MRDDGGRESEDSAASERPAPFGRASPTSPSPTSPSPASASPAQPSEIGVWERFLSGETSADEESAVREWSASVAGSSGAADELRAAVRNALAGDEAPPAIDATLLLTHLERRLAIGGRDLERSRERLGRGGQVRRVWLGRHTATLSIACAAAAVVMMVVTGDASMVTTGRTVRVGPHDTGTYRTGRGERMRLRLPDGTDVSVAPASAVRIGRVSDRQRRDVYVTGEAYFSVARDPARPLTVHAANAVLEDEGARFSVRTDTGAGEVRVAVAAGIVMLGDSGAPRRAARLLTRGALGVVDAAGSVDAIRARHPDDPAMWQAGASRFEPDRIRDALPGRST